jgi:IclR family transcriptional regulator, KDG regulon repressor
MKTTKRDYTVDAVARSLSILETMAQENRDMGVLEISQKVGIHVSTVYRLLNTLMTHQFVEQNARSEKYLLGIKFFELGMARLRMVDSPSVAIPFLRKLHQKIGETVLLGSLRHDEVLITETFSQYRGIVFKSQVGITEPLYCTGIGKALLAHLNPEHRDQIIAGLKLRRYTSNTIVSKPELRRELRRIRQHGYSIDDEEIEPGVKCLGAPILSHDGYAAAAFSISGPSQRIEARLREISQHVLETAKNISRELGYSSSTPVNATG